MSVYVIGCAGLLKIGYSETPERRCANLFKSSARYAAPRAAYDARGTQRLRLVLDDATQQDEQTIHGALADYSIGCEWFVDEPAVWNFLLTFEPDSLPERITRPDGPVIDAFPAGERGGGNAALATSLLNKRLART